MAKTVEGDMVSDLYQKITAQLVNEYGKQAARTMMKTLDPKNVDRTQSLFLTSMVSLGQELSSNYLAISRNYLELFAEVEGVSLPKSVIRKNIEPFDSSSFAKRMMGAGVYGYKHKLMLAGTPMSILPKNNPFFTQSVNNAVGDFTAHTLRQGRNSIGRISTDKTSTAFVGFARNPSSGACPFCLMLATRNDYVSRRSASFDAHRSCSCTPEPVAADWEPSPENLAAYSGWMDKQNELNKKTGVGDTRKRLEVKKAALEAARSKPESSSSVSKREASKLILKK